MFTLFSTYHALTFLHIVDTPLTSWNRSSCLELCVRFWNRSLSPLTLRLGLFVFPPVYLKERYNAAKHRVLIINQCLIPQQTEFGERLGVSIHFICRTVVPMGSFLYDLCCLVVPLHPHISVAKKRLWCAKNQKSVSTQSKVCFHAPVFTCNRGSLFLYAYGNF